MSVLLFVAILVLFCLVILVAEQWEELRRAEGEFKSEFREELEKRVVHSLVVIALVGAMLTVFGPRLPFGADAIDLFLGAILASITWPISRILKRRFLD